MDGCSEKGRVAHPVNTLDVKIHVKYRFFVSENMRIRPGTSGQLERWSHDANGPHLRVLPPDLQFPASFPETQDQDPPANIGHPGGLSAEQLGGTALDHLEPPTQQQRQHQPQTRQQQRSHMPHSRGMGLGGSLSGMGMGMGLGMGKVVNMGLGLGLGLGNGMIMSSGMGLTAWAFLCLRLCQVCNLAISV